MLTAAAKYGFALGGGNALLAHGVINRPTQDVDLFTDQEHAVEAAADAVEAALRSAGYQIEPQDEEGGLADIFPEMGQGLAEWMVSTPGGEQMVLQLAYFDRSRKPVVTELGPLLALEDVACGKVCALASRVEPRDYSDTAQILERYSPGELIGFARRLDPGLTARDFADAGRQLDQIDDEVFVRYGMGPSEVGLVRARFAVWPRTAAAASALIRTSPREPQAPSHMDRGAGGRDDPEAGQ